MPIAPTVFGGCLNTVGNISRVARRRRPITLFDGWRRLHTHRMRTVRAGLPDDAADILDDYMRRTGVTLGALLEAFTELVVDVGDDPEALVGRAPEWIGRAQEITVARRRRPQRPSSIE
jgi:hypothetical protein